MSNVAILSSASQIPSTSTNSTEITMPARWLTSLSPNDRQQVKWVAVETLKEHPACGILLTLPNWQAVVHQSVQDSGVLFPLAVAANGEVLDGRYRLRAAKALGIATLPVLTINVDGDDAVHWVFSTKNDREHLSEEERAMLAVQYQGRLSAEYVGQRAKKAVAVRLGRDVSTPESPVGDPPHKLDSRQEACRKFKVSVRKFSAAKRVQKDRPDLFAKVMRGELEAAAAVKSRSKNRNAERAEKAMSACVRLEDVVDDQMENRIHAGEAQDVLKQVADDTASLVLFSPPYHGADVPYDPPLRTLTYDEYKDQLKAVIAESFRISRDGGRLVIVVDTVNNPVPDGDEMLPLAADLTVIARACGWRYWTDLAWLKPEVGGSKTTFGSYARCSAPGWGRDHEWVLIFFKGQKKLAGDLDLCDLTRDEYLDWWRTTWKVNAETRRNIRDVHPAPFPEVLAERLIKRLTYRRDLVIDPYVGSGTTAVVAARCERRYIGIDRSPAYCAFARKRLDSITAEEQSSADHRDAEGARAISTAVA